MIEQETVNALIEAKENLERVQDILHRMRLGSKGEFLEDPYRAHGYVTHAVSLIESILARGR